MLVKVPCEIPDWGAHKVKAALWVFDATSAVKDDYLSKKRRWGKILRPVARVDGVSSQQIKQGILDDYQLLIIPGGCANKQNKWIDDTAWECVKAFLRAGGGYLGVCGGAFVAAQ